MEKVRTGCRDLEARLPLVSVIIPTYNRVHTLPAAVDSVLRQTYDNLEVILVDDGSTDGTESYIKGLADNRVRYIKNTGNHGPAAARNLGVMQAQGEYVAFQDSDDEWHPEKLEKQMPLLLSPEESIDLVYCEYTRYHGDTRRETVPSRDLPASCKQGHILPVLLLQPLIGTPTIVVRKSCFVLAGGFKEELETFEDYEFTVRLSQNHRFGFVEESLVKVNDSPDSVDKRFAARIRTQAYIVREMTAPLRKYDLLWEKLSALQKAAEHFKCHDVFLEELRGMADLFLTEQEREKAALLAEKTEQSDAKQNQRKETAHETLRLSRQKLVELYVEVYRDKPVEAWMLDQTLRQTGDSVKECLECFDAWEKFPEIPDRVDSWGHRSPASDSKLERLSLLTDVVKAVEELERYIYGQRIECSVCNGGFYRNPSHRCPYCEADEGERLLVAFLQELQPQEGERLAVLQMTSSRLVEHYLQSRKDMLCDCFVPDMTAEQAMQGIEGEGYDILICPAFTYMSDQIREAVKTWSGIMKSGGVCLVFPPLGGEWQNNVNWPDDSDLCVNEVGQEWFGEAFYRTHGFESGTTLTVLTKAGSLSDL